MSKGKGDGGSRGRAGGGRISKGKEEEMRGWRRAHGRAGYEPEDEVQVLVCDQNTNPMLEKKSMTHQKKQKRKERERAKLGSLLTHVLYNATAAHLMAGVVEVCGVQRMLTMSHEGRREGERMTKV